MYLNTLFPSTTSKLVLHQPSKGTNASFLGVAPSRKEMASGRWEIIISFSETILSFFFFYHFILIGALVLAPINKKLAGNDFFLLFFFFFAYLILGFSSPT